MIQLNLVHKWNDPYLRKAWAGLKNSKPDSASIPCQKGDKWMTSRRLHALLIMHLAIVVYKTCNQKRLGNSAESLLKCMTIACYRLLATECSSEAARMCENGKLQQCKEIELICRLMGVDG